MQFELIDGERVACDFEMPAAWYEAVGSGVLNHVPDIEFIDVLFRRWYYAMCERGFSDQAQQTVEFYAVDWLTESYPDFDELTSFINVMNDFQNRLAIIHAAEVIFREFGYQMPASFYEVLIAPALRGDVREARLLRYSEPDADMARGMDASLHAFGKAYDIHELVQAISSQHGFLVSHGCNCNHKTTDIKVTSDPRNYRFESEEQKWRQVMAFWWHMWWEYAMFDVQPNTLVGSMYIPVGISV